MSDFVIKKGDRLPLLRQTLLGQDDLPLDLTGVIGVTFRYRRKGDTTGTIYGGAAAVVDATAGLVEYAWSTLDTATAGQLYCEWRIEFDPGVFLTVPNTGPFITEVVDSLAVLEPGELLLSVSELKRDYLFGVSLTDDNGQAYPQEMFEHYIRAAVAWLEKELDIPLEATDVTERHDHFAQDYSNWGYFQLDRFPVISITEVSFQYPSMLEKVVIDPRWIVLEDGGKSGVVQIVPGQGNIADVLLIPGSLLPMWSGSFGRVPAVWGFEYRAGFEVGSLPADLKHVIAMAAAIGPLNIAGDLIVGAGIATTSIGIPGLNQSVGTTSSATNAGYGARIIEYQKEIKAAVPNLRRYFGKGTRMVVA